MVQLALIFYSGEGRTKRGNEQDENAKFFNKPDETKMTFLPEFDPSLYKAQRIKELVVGSDIKEILSKRPEYRSEEEIQQVLFALRTYQTFAEYPLNMQSDPGLVTSSGERVLVTKSGWPLNRGQISLISGIGGNLSCH
eukprot:sb/3474402/